MKTDRFTNSDVTYYNEWNFSLDEWEAILTKTAMTTALREIKVYMRNEIDNRFKRERGPRGYPWKALSPLTVDRKGGYKGILKYTGRFQKSIRVTVYGNELIISARTPYAKILQTGASYRTTPKQSYWMWHNLFGKKGHPFAPRNIKIPARVVMGFSKGNEKEIRKILISKIRKSERLGKYPL